MPEGFFDSVTSFINSPTAQFAAGSALAAIVWKFFDRVEAVLTDNTKKEIARWLRARNFDTGLLLEEAEPWPETFAKVFDRVFGYKHLSWKCFWRSSLASYLALAITALLFLVLNRRGPKPYGGLEFKDVPLLVALALFVNVVPDYLSLLGTRFNLNLMIGCRSRLQLGSLLIFDLFCKFVIAVTALELAWVIGWELRNFPIFGVPLYPLSLVWRYIKEGSSNSNTALWFYPAFFTSIWLWLYTGSGFILKAARRFDLGFGWFNRKIDIEKKPLSAIGLVAGAVVAVVWWTFVIVRRILG